jgi:hypothetical protein
VDNKVDFTTWARNLPVESIPAALAQLAAVQSTLAARLMGNISDAADGSKALNNSPELESLVDAKEMARRLDVHESWVRTEQRRQDPLRANRPLCPLPPFRSVFCS